MEFNEIAAVSGKGGLFKVVNPTRTGVILESLDEEKKKLVVGMNSKVSVLSDISIFTTEEDGAVPLTEVMKTIHAEYAGDTGLDKNADGAELKAFLKSILPEYDESRVYVSDIKKLVTWYNLLAELDPEIFNQAEGDTKEEQGE